LVSFQQIPFDGNFYLLVCPKTTVHVSLFHHTQPYLDWNDMLSRREDCQWI